MKIDKKLTASGGFAPHHHQGLCPWTPLGAQPPDPRWQILDPPLVTRNRLGRGLAIPNVRVSVRVIGSMLGLAAPFGMATRNRPEAIYILGNGN